MTKILTFIMIYTFFLMYIYIYNNNKLPVVGLSFIVGHRISLNKCHALRHNTAQTLVNRPTQRQTQTHGQYLPTACSHPPLQQGSTSQSRDEQNTERKRRDNSREMRDRSSGQNTDIRLKKTNTNNNTSTDIVCLTSDLYTQCV